MKQLIHIFFFTILVSAFAFTSKPGHFNNPNNTVFADSLVAFAKQQIGTHYCYGSSIPKTGFDCSGFVYYTFAHFDIKVPRASMDYERNGKIINPDSCKVGDVIVFTGTNAKNRRPGHVGIILSNPGEDIKFIHSSSSKKGSGVKISTFKESPYYKVRFIKIVRVANVI